MVVPNDTIDSANNDKVAFFSSNASLSGYYQDEPIEAPK